MSGPPPPSAAERHAALTAELGRAPRPRTRLLAGLILALLAAAIVVIVVANPFSGAGAPRGGVSDNSYPTALASVTERSLTQQQTVSGTLGYAGDSTIRMPSGTSPSAVSQAEQQLATARQQLATARATLSADDAALTQARSAWSADRQEEAVSCAGSAAAQGAATSGSGAAGGGGSGACATAAQTLATDRQSVTADAARVTADEAQLASAQRSLTSASNAIGGERAHETLYGQGSTYTALPSTGRVIHRNQSLYAIDGEPVILLHGSTVATRAFYDGMSPGPDVAELNANLDALGYGRGLTADAFTAATAAAIRSFQAAHGITPSGELPLGAVVFEPGDVRVTGMMPSLGIGANVTPGPVLTVSSTRRQVTVPLDAADQGSVAVGDSATITLPDNTTTPGRISYVSSVATSQPNGGGTTVTVDVVPTDPAATGTVDQAPVDVEIVTASVSHALVVPVDALLALASGGYAVEVVAHGGVHRLLAVSTGLFDDADGLVQVTGAGLAAGERVVVPGT